MFRSIKSKFIFFSLTFIVLSVGVPTFFLINQFQNNFEQRSEVLLDISLDMLMYSINTSMLQGQHKDVQKIVDNIVSNENIHHLRLFSKEGKILYSSEPNEKGKNIFTAAEGHVDSNFSSTQKRIIHLIDDKHAFSAIEPIKNNEACQSCHGSTDVIAYVDVDSHLTSAEKNFFTGSVHFVYLGFAILIVLVVGFFFIFNYFISHPLRNFIDALEKVEEGDLKVELPISREDEFGLLNSHFNRMVTELSSSLHQIDEMHAEQLRRADKMVTIGEISAEMAHDINNHSAVIMARADYLQMKSESNKNINECSEDLQVILDHVEKISNTTGSILKHSKKLSKEFIDLNILKSIEETLQNLSPLLNKKEILITKNFETQNVNVFANPEQIEQVLMNLINNAIDAMDKNGNLEISVKSLNDEEIELSIKDNGEGIDAGTIDKIFSPFYTTKAGDKGTGLGLYIVKNICKNHNAEIECKSKVNVGTTFLITFQVKKEDG